jgi:alginate O-acetyltransferase complex protein AlgI
MTPASLSFLLFLFVALAALLFANERSVRARNAVLLVANLLFYGSWSAGALPFVLVSTALTYWVGRRVAASKLLAPKRSWLGIGLVLAVLPLAYVKYLGLFWDAGVAGTVGGVLPTAPRPQDLLLPIGLSFSTFVKVSYLVDVYRGSIQAERDWLAFAAYLTFFPVALAGPIERAGTLLSQLRKRTALPPGTMADAVQMFLWGALKKVVVADGVGVFVDRVFAQQAVASGGDLALGTVLFSVQIYADFSGYSEMAVAVGRVLGIELTRNFACPYFSRDIGEFWRRWHISLSSWLRDYVFFPLGANFRGRLRTAANILVTFVLCGLWHGANWTFLGWGMLVGLYLLPSALSQPARRRSRMVAHGRRYPTAGELIQVARTFALVTVAWVPFRSRSLGDALDHMIGMLTRSWLACPIVCGGTAEGFLTLDLLGPLLVATGVFWLEWIQRERRHALDGGWMPPWLQASVCYTVVVLLLAFSTHERVRFLYGEF